MRPVKFKSWHEYPDAISNLFNPEDFKTGLFHQWGTTSQFTEDSGGYFPVTVGIVEDASGKIYLAVPGTMQFTDRDVAG